MSSQMRNIGEYIAPVSTVVPQALSGTTAVHGTAVDRLTYGMNLSAVLEIDTGATTGTPTSFTVTAILEHCSTSGGTYAQYTDPKTGLAVSVVASAASGRVTLNVDLSAAKEFIRITLTPAFVGGTSPTVLAAGNLVMGGGPELTADSNLT